MKKLLALVLTLVMTMSLMTVSNAAAFSDDANIDYKEAVEVMAAVGVLAGDGTGAFGADGELTRAAAAKIVTYLMIGADAAEGLVGSAVFTDVPADHWAAGYIGYLVSEGVVAGVGDGKFDPNGKVTALQFAKMLLVALGYDASIEKLTGADWSINTSKLAYEKKLFEGNDNVKVNSVATRQEAALYAFNALNTEYMVYETKGTSIIIGDASVVTSASTAKKNSDGAGNTAAKLYTKLYGTDLRKGIATSDSYGNPASQWLYKGKEVGKFSTSPVVTFTTEFNANELIDAVEAAGYSFDTTVDGSNYDVSVSFANNGVADQPETTKSPDATKTWLDNNAKTDFDWSGKGVKVDVFANDDGVVNKIVVTKAVLAEITGKTEDKVSTKTVDERKLLTSSYTMAAEDSRVADGFDAVFAAVEEGDSVVIVPDGSNSGKALKVYVPTKVTGDVSYYKSGSSLTVGGTSYSLSKGSSVGVSAGDEGVTLYVDEFGYAIGADGGSTTAASLVVLDTYQGLSSDGVIIDMLYVLYADGTTARVPSGTMAGYNATATAGQLYIYDENDDDETCLKSATTASGSITDVNEGETLRAATQAVANNAKGITLGTGRNFFAAGVKYIYVSQNSNNVWEFTVSDKLQDLANTVELYAVIDADGNISTLYVIGAAAKNTVKDGSALIFIAETDGVVNKLDKNGKKVTLNQYVAFIDGVAVDGFVAEGGTQSCGFYENEYDTDNGWYVLAGNAYNDASEDIKVTSKEVKTKTGIISDKYITVDTNVDVELTSATKYASSIDETPISSLAELKAELNDVGTSADLYVVYDNETGVALYVYVTAINN